MHLRKLATLLLVVGGLAALALWQRGEQQSLRTRAEAALLSGFDRTRVRSIRVDNLERGLQLRVERRPTEWQIVDPVDFPAEMAVIEVLLDSLATQHAKPAPDTDPAKVALDPPRVLLEIEEDLGGRLLQRRIEVGAVDLDENWVFARADGVIFRTERALDSTLERDLPDWRSRFLLRMSARQVVELRRTGSILFDPKAEASDLGLVAMLDGGWRAAEPFEAALDGETFERMLVGACAMRAFSFIDAPGPLREYGLDPARLRVELVSGDGRREALLLAPEGGGEMWYAAREGAPYVFRIGPDAVMSIASPSAGLIQREFASVARDSVLKVEFTHGERATTLVRVERGWQVRASEGGKLVLAGDVADAQLVGDALGVLERARIDDFLMGRSLASQDVVAAIRVHTPDDVQGGVFGPSVRTADGVEAVEFRRDGDSLVSLVSSDLLALAARPADSWRSLDLHRVPEIEVARIELLHGPATRAYGREDKGRWVRMGTTLEAKEFAKLVDRVLNVRAEQVLQRGDETLRGAVTVRIVRYSGDGLEFSLGDLSLPDGSVAAAYRTGARLALVKGELLGALRALLQSE
ncbi:MAG: DUF4340 domain-containing protein [Planctomycetes bacterium]|nr:DUF4340 domain-containing protein [Planctomycetota bacterium]